MTRATGFTYEADLHCYDCTESRFGAPQDAVSPWEEEGNEIGAVFATTEFDYAPTCSDCGAPIEASLTEEGRLREACQADADSASIEEMEAASDILDRARTPRPPVLYLLAPDTALYVEQPNLCDAQLSKLLDELHEARDPAVELLREATTEVLERWGIQEALDTAS